MEILRQTNHTKLIVIMLMMVAGLMLAGCNGGLLPELTYQGVLTDANGNPLNGQVTITFRIFNQLTGGTALFTDSKSVTVTDGHFDSVIGSTGSYDGLTPEVLAQPLWVEIQIDNGTYVETLSPRQRLYGSPYAFTLMPGAVIATSLSGQIGAEYDVNAVTTVINRQTSDPIPVLRLEGQQGLELVDISGTQGSIYSDMDHTSSDLDLVSNDDIMLYLDKDNNEPGAFIVHGNPTTTFCSITDSGNFFCNGSKSSVVTVENEQRALYALESPEVWFEDFGSSNLKNGTIRVQVDPMFAESVNLDVDYHVFLTPLGDCSGLFVTNKTGTGFEVRELGGGTSNVRFDYRIVAKRAGYEDLRMEVVPDSVVGIGQ